MSIAAVARNFFFIIVQKNISTFLGCQWKGILQMNKALTPGNERRILRRMKSIFFSSQYFLGSYYNSINGVKILVTG